jgi:phytoene dehydrogenase-like protein
MIVALEENDGDVALGEDVRRILVEDGRVRGVELEGGRRVEADVVVSNADARHTFDDLVGREHLAPAFARRLDTLEPSLAACVVYAATTLDVSELMQTHETFVFPSWDHEQTYADLRLGKVASAMWLSLPTLADPSLAPPGEHLVVMSALVPYDAVDWKAEAGRAEEELVAAVEALLPGFREKVTFLESATPLTLERFTRNYKGAIYGWANTASQMGTKRLPHETPVQGLFLSGHWTQPGGTSFRVFASGIHTAQLVTRAAGTPDAIPSFAEAQLPALM